MENMGEAVDDQGSGWFEVKKKHRTGAKFSIRKWSGGFSGKNGSGYQTPQSSMGEKGGNMHGKRRSQVPKEGGNLSVHGRGDANDASVSTGDGNDMPCLDKSVFKKDSEDGKYPNSSQLHATNSTAKAGGTQKILHADKPDVVHKIKWGDLEDDVLVTHHDKTSCVDAKFGDTVDNNLTAQKVEDVCYLVSDAPSSTDPRENELMPIEVNPDQTMPMTNNEDIVEVKCKKVSQNSPNDVSNGVEIPSGNFRPIEDYFSCTCQEDEVKMVSKLQVTSLVSEVSDSEKVPQDRESILTQKGQPEISVEVGIEELQLPAVSAVNKPKTSELAVMDRNASIISPSDCELLPTETSDPENSIELKSKVNELLSELSIVNKNSNLSPVTQDSEALTSGKHGPESSVEYTASASAKVCGDPLNKTINNGLLKAQAISPLDEGDTGESKERFRERLWCFLFENLNRAVDELYLLCELECDVEQMKEAILVLEEAASDFKELSTRVQGFENVKRSSSQSTDGISVPFKSDHRRPHALSWEVRRMTTSPHRAEILSSSLEAFKKIQHERANMLAANNGRTLVLDCSNHYVSDNNVSNSAVKNGVTPSVSDSMMKSTKQSGSSDLKQSSLNNEKRTVELGRCSKVNFIQNGRDHLHNSSSLFVNSSRLSSKDNSAALGVGKTKRESDVDKLLHKKEKTYAENTIEKNLKSCDGSRKLIPLLDKDKEKRNSSSWKSMDAWKEKRNWEDILSSPFRVSSRISHSPGMGRKSAERARILHDKLMSPEKKKKTAWDLKKEAEEKHARAMRIRSELENERVQKLQRTSEKLNRVNEWQAVRTMKLREGMYARHQRSESRHEAFLAQVVRRAGDESSKVNEVRFITSLNEENKKLMLLQKHQESELRRARNLQLMKSKQKEEMAREEAVVERRKLMEAEKLQRLAETQRKKEEAQVRREEERKASSAAREARAIEQLRRREERAKAQQEEAELLAQKLAERLSESEQRRKFYLEQIRERASMDFRDQPSPLFRRSMNKDTPGRSTPTNSGEVYQENIIAGTKGSALATGNAPLQHSLKRRIKKIRQRLMALKYEFSEPPGGSENAGIGYRTAVATARAKLGRWLQELQRLRQARKEGAASIGLITAEMIKFLDGKDHELQACRQAGLLDFIASALPASHTSKPEACQVMLHLQKLLRVVLSVPANRSYFLAQNLLPPIIPMLSTALENYIKIAASLNVTGITNPSSKTSVENFESISEVLDNFLWIVGAVIGHTSSDERELQMRDGLLELLVAYQIVHRLRDLFALYDRPQVEGSPFPSSILLSIHLLVVLTYSPRTYCKINWETCPVERVIEFENNEAKLAEVADFAHSSANLTSEEYRPPLSVLNGSTIVSPPDISEDRLESYSENKSEESLSIGRDGEKKATCSSVELNDANNNLRGGPNESEKTSVEKDEKDMVNIGAEVKNNNKSSIKQPVAFFLSAISETGLVSLPSLLTAVLLHANNRSSSDQGSYALPSNFEVAATGVLKVLNNLAHLDITFIQRMLARPDLKMEFFHLTSFLLSHCSGKWKVANDQVGLLLHESLLLLSYFALFHPENQAVLRWGKSPTILHKVCDLPFVFFSDPELMPVLGGTLVAACYGCEQNKSVVLQELSMDMLLSLLVSCRSAHLAARTNQNLENFPVDDPSESNQQNSEKRSQGDVPLRPNRHNAKSYRISSGKANLVGNNSRGGKMRSQRDYRTGKTGEEMASKHNPLAPESSVMLHCRFPNSFIDRAEQFFSAGTANIE